MSVSIYELINFLQSDTNNMSDYINSIKQIKKLDSKIYGEEYNFSVTNFSYDTSLNNLLFCLLYTNIIPGYEDSLITDNLDQFDRKIIQLNSPIITNVRNTLISIVNSDKYTFPFSKKKILSLINSNQYNHEIILIICALYDVNIYIFYKDNNFIKLYYPEDKLITKKQHIFIQYSKDTYSSLNTLQIMHRKLNPAKCIFKWNEIEHLIKKNKNNIYPIGILENKDLFIDESINYTYDNIFMNCNKNTDSIYLKDILFNEIKITDMKTYRKILSSNNYKMQV
jgi:hypothetical protein